MSRLDILRNKRNQVDEAIENARQRADKYAAQLEINDRKVREIGKHSDGIRGQLEFQRQRLKRLAAERYELNRQIFEYNDNDNDNE